MFPCVFSHNILDRCERYGASDPLKADPKGQPLTQDARLSASSKLPYYLCKLCRDSSMFVLPPSYEKDYIMSAFWLIWLLQLFKRNTKITEHNSNGKWKSWHLIGNDLRMRSLSSRIISLHYWFYLCKNSLPWSISINLTFPVCYLSATLMYWR